jgi:hypothetical protein
VVTATMATATTCLVANLMASEGTSSGASDAT